MEDKSMSVQVFPRQPWARQPEESDWQYAAFQRFIDTHPMDRQALLPVMSVEIGKEDWEIKQAARNNHWLSRAAKYDAWMDATQRQGAFEKRRQLGAELVKLSEDVLRVAKDGMKILSEDDKKKVPTYRELADMYRVAIELQRAGFNMQGVSAKEDTQDLGVGNPQDYIEAAMQINIEVRKKAQKIELPVIDDEDVIDGEATEIE